MIDSTSQPIWRWQLGQRTLKATQRCATTAHATAVMPRTMGSVPSPVPKETASASRRMKVADINPKKMCSFQRWPVASSQLK